MEVQEGDPKTKVNVKDLFAGKKGVLFAVPGAFTPGCSKVRNNFVPVVPWPLAMPCRTQWQCAKLSVRGCYFLQIPTS